jgi:UDP-N-acetylmuramoyl-L-alanyl-D-glutamate--2,6-diaminopimelate ligase
VRLHDLLDGLEIDADAGSIIETRGDCGVAVQTVEHDSRAVTPGALFCCIPGEHVDGHDFAAAAVAAGASACLVERGLDVSVPQIVASTVRGVVGPIAARVAGDPSRGMRVLGVTGTNGKTTTTYLLEAIAAAAGENTGRIGTTGAQIGTHVVPLAHTTPEATELQALLARMRNAGTAVVAMEVSSHALDQHRVDATRFAVACFTNLTQDHLDYHASLDDYFAAKARLFTPQFTSAAAIGVDGAYGVELAQRARRAGLEVLTFAVAHGDADVIARDVELAAHGSRCTVLAGGEPIELRTSLVGRFNLANAFAAFATARLAGLPDDAILEALAGPIVVPGRFESVDAGQPFAVFVDYAHTPDALTSVLGAARELVAPGARLSVVFGCGGDRDRSKRPLMGRAAVTGSDRAWLTNDNPRNEDPEQIARDVLAGIPAEGPAPEVELDRRAAIRAALHAAGPGDVVVIAGKGHERGQIVGAEVLPFDDRVVAREELAARV